MSGNIDILLRLPEVAQIGRTQLQAYCDEWLQRPIAQQYGVSHLIVGSDLLLTLNWDAAQVKFVGDRAFVPIFELLGYVIDRHFSDSEQRKSLHAESLAVRQNWATVGYYYKGMAARVGMLWIKCKNPNCDVSMESGQQAVEGQRIHCPPSNVTCPGCGHNDLYDGNDLHLRFPQQ